MEKTIGFIGCGNMAQAMMGSIIKSEIVPASSIIASELIVALREMVGEKFGIKITADNKEVAKESDYLILAIKPFVYEIVLSEIKDYIKEGCVVIGIGAGISSDFLRQNVNEDTKYLKVMPNTPAMVGEGMTAISPNERLNQEDIDEILEIFNSFGKTEIIDESLMDGFTALCGSSPAYIYMLIEAMADAGVMEGIPRPQAYTMAAQSVLGSAKMVLETGMHPGQLKDNVCSPGGTTIAAVGSLEENGFRAAMIKAIKTCADKSREMSK